MPSSGQVRIGISGWRYKPWRGIFYPKGLAHKRELEYASQTFPTIEINSTFYSLQHPRSFQQWCAQTPADFVFSVKGSRYMTHMLKLRNIEAPLANFFAQGVLDLNQKLGPILWQFAPTFKFDPEKLAAFFNLLPRNTTEAAIIARRHDPRLKDRSSFGDGLHRNLRHCIEIRHESFVTPDFIALLRHHRIGLVVADTVEWPLLMDVTADFLYCRLHGSEQLYTSNYSGQALDLWAERLAAWRSGGELPRASQPKSASLKLNQPRHASLKAASRRTARDCYVYFDNDAKVHAPFDALQLNERLRNLLV